MYTKISFALPTQSATYRVFHFIMQKQKQLHSRESRKSRETGYLGIKIITMHLVWDNLLNILYSTGY